MNPWLSVYLKRAGGKGYAHFCLTFCLMDVHDLCCFHIYLSRPLTHCNNLCQAAWAGPRMASYPGSKESQSWAVSCWHCSIPGPLSALCLFCWEGNVKTSHTLAIMGLPVLSLLGSLRQENPEFSLAWAT